MTSTPEPNLRQALHDLVDFAGPMDLADQALARASRLRARRTTLSVAAALAVVGVAALPFASGAVDIRDNHAPGGLAASSGTTTAVVDKVLRTAACVTATSPAMNAIEGMPDPLSVIAHRIMPRAETEFATVYAGLEAVRETNRIRVYRKPSTEFDQWILRDLAADCVEVLDAKYSAVELAAFQQRVSSDHEYWRQRGLVLNSVGTDPTRGVVWVGTLDVDLAERELAARYGAEVPIEVRRQEPIVGLLGR